MADKIRILNGVIDIVKIKDEDHVVLRGIIDPRSYDDLKVDTYQREVLNGTKSEGLKEAVANSMVPDIELGVRGSKMKEFQGEVGKDFFIYDPIYIVDGLQRTTAAKKCFTEKPDAPPRLGAVIFFGTDFNWERQRFQALNQGRTKISPNILLRNAVEDSEGVELLYKLCKDPSFALKDRVQWKQNRARTELVSAMTLLRLFIYLHARFVGSSDIRGDHSQLAARADKITREVGKNTARDNIRNFFEILDECFTVRHITYGHAAVQVKDTFVTTLAELVGRIGKFWAGHRLLVQKPIRDKLAKFKIDDPEVVRLGGAGGAARRILMELIFEHLNSGKRSQRLSLDGSIETSVDKEESEPMLA
jgi:hypothetical protein